MTVYDGVMAVIVLYTVIHGYFRGAAWQTAPIISLVLGYMIAMPMSITMAHYFGAPPLNRLFALVTIYLLVSVTVYLMVRSFRNGIDKAKLTEIDRHLGAILGGVKGVLLTLVATCALLIYFPQMREVVLKSESSSVASKIISNIYPILPNAMHTLLDPYLKKLEEQLPIAEAGGNDGFQGSSGVPIPRSRPPAFPTPEASGSDSPFRLDPTAALQDVIPTAPQARRAPLRSTPEPLEPTTVAPRRRPVVKSAQEDDPFEAANPDRAVSPPR